MLLTLALLAADPTVLALKTDVTRLEQPAEAPRRSPYRLDPSIDTPADTKAAALRVDGGQCAVVGARLCTRKPRTIYSVTR